MPSIVPSIATGALALCLLLVQTPVVDAFSPSVNLQHGTAAFVGSPPALCSSFLNTQSRISSKIILNAEEENEAEASSDEPEASVEETEEEEPEEETEEEKEIKALKEQIDTLEATLKSKRFESSRLEDEMDDYTENGYYRKCAEIENVRKRRDLAFSNQRFVARAGVVQKFLPVLDDLTALQEKYEGDEFAKGYDALRGSFKQSLKKLDVEDFDAVVGEPVDRLRCAIVDYEFSDEFAKGVVTRAVKGGLDLKGHTVRFADCVASKGSYADAQAEAQAVADAAAKEEEEAAAAPEEESGDEKAE